MTNPPKYTQTPLIQKIIHQLDVLKTAFALVPVEPSLSLKIRRASFLRSSLFSARIEGNPLQLKDISQLSLTYPASTKKHEVADLVKALNYLYQNSPPAMTGDFLKKLHGLVLSGISPEAGRFRTEVSAIFNMAGVAIYMPPPPQQINQLLQKWCRWCNVNLEPGPIQAALAHFWFEKIHPFLDGNGRVGRLVMSWTLNHTGYDLGGIVSFEEYLDNHRQEYYDGLNMNANDITSFVEFFLTAYETQARKALEHIKNPPPQTQSNLLPRRQEIVDIIRDHTMVSFDVLWRRFQKVPKSTLHFDLKQLIKSGIIKKLGTTRGVVYTTT